MLVQGAAAARLGNVRNPAHRYPFSGEHHRHKIDPPYRGSEIRRGTTHMPFLVVVEVLFGSGRPRCSRLDLDCDPLTAKLDQQVDLTAADPDISVDDHCAAALEKRCSDVFADSAGRHAAGSHHHIMQISRDVILRLATCDL